MLTTFFVEGQGGGGVIRERGGFIKKFNLQMGGLYREGGLLELLRYVFAGLQQLCYICAYWLCNNCLNCVY